MAIADGKTRLGERFELPDPKTWSPPPGFAPKASAAMYGFSAHTSFFQTAGQYDLPRMREGGLTAQSMAIYIEDEHLNDALERALSMVWWLNQEASENADFVLATTSDDIRAKKRDGNIAGFLAFEGFEPLGGELRFLDLFYQLGLCMATLTHSRRNIFADGTMPGIHSGGLTAPGKRAVNRMNELGIVIDLAHLAYPGCDDVVALSDAPVILSHGSVPYMFRGGGGKASDHAATDADVRRMAEAIAKTGGVIGEIAYSHPTLEAFLDDIQTLISWVGAEHVGLGSDFFGLDSAPTGFTGIQELPNVTRGLVDRGLSDEQV